MWALSSSDDKLPRFLPSKLSNVPLLFRLALVPLSRMLSTPVTLVAKPRVVAGLLLVESRVVAVPDRPRSEVEMRLSRLTVTCRVGKVLSGLVLGLKLALLAVVIVIGSVVVVVVVVVVMVVVRGRLAVIAGGALGVGVGAMVRAVRVSVGLSAGLIGGVLIVIGARVLVLRLSVFPLLVVVGPLVGKDPLSLVIPRLVVVDPLSSKLPPVGVLVIPLCIGPIGVLVSTVGPPRVRPVKIPVKSVVPLLGLVVVIGPPVVVVRDPVPAVVRRSKPGAMGTMWLLSYRDCRHSRERRP